MPELPEVEVVKQSLEKYIVNKRLLKIVVKIKKLRFYIPTNLSKKLSTLKILQVTRISKYVVINFEHNFFFSYSLRNVRNLTLNQKFRKFQKY